MGTYSFADIQAAISGPGGSFSIGQGAGAADEGITVEYIDDKTSMTTGAGGEGQHNLHASKAGRITVRLLKTSPANALLSDLYNYQSLSAATTGRNTITIRDSARGDSVTGNECAFVKHPNLGYAKAGAIQEWAFNVIRLDIKLGTGNPSAL